MKIIIAFTKHYIWTRIKICWDRKSCRKPAKKTTKKKTIQEYVDLYGGPEFYVEWSYSNVMKMVYITLMLGTGIPILYYFCSFNFFILYVTEKYNFAYRYKRPPSYNNLISEDTLKWLRWGFFLHMMVGFWMMSSKGLYFNLKTPPSHVGGYYGEHSLLSFVIPNVGWPMSIAGFIFLWYMIAPLKIY